MNICHDRFKALLRFGRKNKGEWSATAECTCDYPDICEVPDDDDVETLIKAYDFYKAAYYYLKENADEFTTKEKLYDGLKKIYNGEKEEESK